VVKTSGDRSSKQTFGNHQFDETLMEIVGKGWFSTENIFTRESTQIDHVIMAQPIRAVRAC
jgi:hypothetical protein